MHEDLWEYGGRKYLVCVDSYEEGVMKGRIWNPYREPEHFSSLSQFLLKMEAILDDQQAPQACTAARRFAELLPLEPVQSREDSRRGVRSTFELRVIFRRNSSWQGVLLWRETRQEQSFRSVLEMVILMDSALRRRKECGCH